jgi:predicted Zn finger-like uncharacterized protein
MIISCINCNKKFDINSDLIPEKGRLVQCGGCNHKWFFNKKILITESRQENIDNIINSEIPVIFKKNEKSFNEIKNNSLKVRKKEIPKNTEIIINQAEDAKKRKKNVKKNNLLRNILVLIISFIAFIIIVDTFKYPLSIIFPNIELMLYNLYESIKDIILFFEDLI